MKLTLILTSFAVSVMSVCAQTPDYRQTLRLYEKGLYGRSKMMFDRIEEKTGKADPAGYSLLCDVRSDVPGYENRIEAYIAEYPYSVLIPQIRYHHALNLFDKQEYGAALNELSQVEERSLYRSQRVEFAFKTAYCNLEKGNIYSAREGFLYVLRQKNSDFAAPSMYAIGYIEYQLKHFEEALTWFEKARTDKRFEEIASYYIVECKFMLKDYEYVTASGSELYPSVLADRKPHLARLLSESYLVLGNVELARKYYDLSLAGGRDSNTRADWFYGGSVLYAGKDYAGAIDNFTRMGELTDSLGQIASYNLGYSYVQTKNKVLAMASFKNASELNFDRAIEEDALFNYAKLAFDLNKDISVFNDYLQKYSDVRKGDVIYSYMAVAALQDRDYAAAVSAYDKVEELDEDMERNYMKANYLRAHQLIANGSYRMAVPCLKSVIYYAPKDSRLNQLSRFWLAESYYRNDQYSQARTIFTELYNVSALYGQAESYLLPYNIAYCYFKEGNYSLAKKWFGEYFGEKSVIFRKEALLRKADCDFVIKNYRAAATAYDLVLRDYFDVNDIYPYYQSALSYGLVNDYDKKIELLSNVMNASEDAKFYPEALFELGRTYAVREDDDKAVECFDKITKSVKDSTFVAKSYIELGSIARNQSMFNEALGYYKIVVEQMPLSEYADDALLSIESIYQTKNDLQEYLAYIESIGKGEMKTEEEKESMIFNSAEQVFLSENYSKALVSLQSYKDQYPSGKNVYKADFYMAESYKLLGKIEQACDCYKDVITSGEGSFVELSMLNFSNLSFKLERWEDAFGGYSSLKEAAKFDNNIYLALVGMMRSAYKGHMWDKAIAGAEALKESEQCSDADRAEAEYTIAKSYLATSRRDDAFAILENLSKDTDSAYGAEASYLLVQDCYDKGDFEQVETKVFAFVDAGSSQTYWMAKMFIVLGDSFVERDELEQAKATFESVRDGYSPSGEDDVLDNVKLRLDKIAELMAENTQN